MGSDLAAVLLREVLAVEAEGTVGLIDRAAERARETPEPAAAGESVQQAVPQTNLRHLAADFRKFQSENANIQQSTKV